MSSRAGSARRSSRPSSRAAADKTLMESGVDPRLIHADGWYPLRSAPEVLEQVETRFGDGTYETVRRMMRDEAINFSSLRRFLKRVIPFPILLELSPNSYARERNHGSLEVDVEGHRAIFRNYDWMSSPARCAAWLGTYEGSLIMLGIAGTVTKVACILRGDPYCGYRIDW